jgi:hypothetical protein
MLGTDSLRVFLCHASSDKHLVRALYQRLVRIDGVEPWLDEVKLVAGQDWDREIRKAVRSSHAIIVCLSPNSINREGYVQKEMRQALDLSDEKPDGTVFLIPARLERCEVPERLRRWQWVDLFEPDGFERLMRSLALRAETLGLAFPNVEGHLIYEPAGDVAFASWTFHSSVGVSNERIRFGSRRDSVMLLDLQVFASESVGANKSLRTLHGRVEYEYEVVSGSASNIFFCMIPMQETGIGRKGLIEVGTDVQHDPRNAKSRHRIRSFVPAGHCGDGEWHRGTIEFDFRQTPTAFYSIFAPRINEGCEAPSAGRLLVAAVRAYSFETR